VHGMSEEFSLRIASCGHSSLIALSK
jgi:hypothetical protein